MVIAGSINNDFELWKIYSPTVGTGCGPWAKRAGMGDPLAVDGMLQVVSELVSHLGSDPRCILRHVVERNEDIAFFERE